MKKKTAGKCLGRTAAFFFAGLLLVVGCSDDSSSTESCGNNVLEGKELCDTNQLGDNTCTSVAGNFIGGNLACSTSCTFDTSGCKKASAKCGNGTLDTEEECDGENLNEATCTTVGNYSGGTLACSAACTYDLTNCTAPVDCGNGTIDTGEDCDGTNLNSLTCATLPGGGFSSGTLSCSKDCSFNTGGCKAVVTSPSAQIQAVLDASDGTGLNFPITGAWVTYVIPAIGDDPAGFFLQATQQGPALFVAVDPATLTPAPVAGDEVSLTVTARENKDGLVNATAISGYSQTASGKDVATLVQDVSTTADIVSDLDGYAAELIKCTVTLVGELKGAGADHLAANIESAGLTGESKFRLRLPTALNATLGLDQGCTLTVLGTPLWRYTTTAQVSIWDTADVEVTSCPGPKVVSAKAASETSVTVTLNREVAASSVLADGSQFTFDNGLTASAATAQGTEITVTTTSQTAGQKYLVTVAGTVQDTFSNGVDAASNTATFTGYGQVTTEIYCDDHLDDDSDGFIDCLDADCVGATGCAWESKLYLWEVDSDQVGTDAAEFVEIWNNTGASVDLGGTDKYFLLFINGSDDKIYFTLQLSGTVADKGIHLIGNSGVSGVAQTFTGNSLQNGADGLLLVQCNACPDAMAFTANDVLGTASTFTLISGQTVTKIDGLAYDTDDADDGDLMGVLGVSEQFNENGNSQKDTQSLQRTAPSFWTPVTPTPGVSQLQ